MNNSLRFCAMVFVMLSVQICHPVFYTVTNEGNHQGGVSVNVQLPACGTLKANLAEGEKILLDTASVCPSLARGGAAAARLKLGNGQNLVFDSDDFGVCFNKNDQKIDLTEGPSGWGIRMKYMQPQ